MDKGRYLTPSQLTLTLVGSMVGTGALVLPIGVVKFAKQDGWISCILGAVYPLYLVFIAQYMHKKFPDQSIIMLSKKYCGKFLGTILGLIFMAYYLFLVTEVAAGINNVLIVYMTPFLNKYKIILIFLLCPAFLSHKGLKAVGRMNEVVFYLTFVVFFIPIASLKEGNYLNIMPVFGSGIINIIKSTKETLFAYAGIESLFVLYPFFKDNKKLKKCSLASIVISGMVFVWLTFISIFYLGVDIIPKFLWPVVTVSEAVTIPIINSFRYIFMTLWTLIMYRILSDFYYVFTLGLSQLTTYISRKSFVILAFPLSFYLSTLYGNPTQRRAFIDKITPICVIYNIVYISTIALLIAIKKGDKSEEKLQ